MLLSSQAPIRYAVRQVLDQELRRTLALRESHARQARFQAGAGAGPVPPSSSAAKAFEEMQARLHPHDNKENAPIAEKLVKRDFFGRIVQIRPLVEVSSQSTTETTKKQGKVWVTYNEGLNNAVRKPLSVAEFLKPL